MVTSTTRLGLEKPDYADAADIAVLNQNFDDIDNAVGMRVVTSTTRPATPWNGQIIFETDTNFTLVWNSTGSTWKPIGNAAIVCTSSTRPASPLNGQLIYETDTRKLLVYSTAASAWRIPFLEYSVADFTALAALTGMVSGQTGFVVEGDVTMMYDGSAWVQQSVAIFATSAARDTAYAKASAAYRVQGVQAYQTDTGITYNYAALYNVSTNPGGRDAAGWYPTTKVDGLVPVQPTSVAVAGGSATVNALGLVSFTTATSVSLNGVFTSAYNSYRMLIRVPNTSGGASLTFRFRNAGTDNTSNNYVQTWFYNRSTGTTQTNNGTGTGAGLLQWNAAESNTFLMWIGDVVNPAVVGRKSLFGKGNSGDATTFFVLDSSIMFQLNTLSFDGFTIFPTAGNITGTVQILGYNQ